MNCWWNLTPLRGVRSDGSDGKGLHFKMCQNQGRKVCLQSYFVVFCCHEDTNNFINILDHFRVKNVICLPKMNISSQNLNIKCQNLWFVHPRWSTIFLKLFAFSRQWKTIPVILQTPDLSIWTYKTPENTPSSINTFCGNILENVDFNF